MTKSDTDSRKAGSNDEPDGKAGDSTCDDRNAAADGDPDRLARDFLTLWQEQLRLLADDPIAARTLAETMALWQRMGMMAPFMAGMGQAGMDRSGPAGNSMASLMGMPGFGAGFPNPFAPPAEVDRASPHPAHHEEGGTHGNPETADPSGSQDRAASPAVSSDGGIRLLRELDRRLARIEERFDRLESELESSRGGAATGAGGKRGQAAPRSRAKSAAKKSPARKSAPRKSSTKKPGGKRKS